MRLTEIPGTLADPRLHRGRGVRAAFFWLLFFAVQRKVTRAKRETLLLQNKDKSQSKIKSTPPQSSPALRAREEAESRSKSKIKMDPSLRWDDVGN